MAETVNCVALPVPVGLVPATATVPPANAIVGAVVNPVPGAVMVIVDEMTLGALPANATVAVAPVPPPPAIVIVGATW